MGQDCKRSKTIIIIIGIKAQLQNHTWSNDSSLDASRLKGFGGASDTCTVLAAGIASLHMRIMRAIYTQITRALCESNKIHEITRKFFTVHVKFCT